jgi:hypothetical protein
MDRATESTSLLRMIVMQGDVNMVQPPMQLLPQATRVRPPASAAQIAAQAVYNTTYGPTFQLTAQYRYQTERSLAQEVRMMQMLSNSL